jgi:imipenem/basic amino acid-specific outer membrane pore
MLYFSRDFRNGGSSASARAAPKKPAWASMLCTNRASPKAPSVSVLTIGLLGVKLDSGKGRAGTGLFPTGSDGRSQDDYSKGGGAVKFRISDTVLKVGDQYTTAQCSPTDDSRLLPELPQGSRSPATKSRA